LNYAVNNSVYLRSGPGFSDHPHKGQGIEDYEFKIVKPLRLSKPFGEENRNSNIPRKPENTVAVAPTNNFKEAAANEFLIMEDLYNFSSLETYFL